MGISNESVGPTPDTFTICGIEGFELCYVADGSEVGGQSVGRRLFTIRIYHEDLGFAAEFTSRSQMEARNKAIFMVGSLIEATQLFSKDDIRKEAQRFLQEDLTETNNQSDSYEF